MNRQNNWTRASVLGLMICAQIVISHSLAVAGDNPEDVAPDPAAALKLPARPGGAQSESANEKTSVASNSLWNSSITLGLIAVTILIAGKWLKRNGFGASHGLPADAFELLGKRAIDPRNTVHLVRCGSRVLVLAVGADGVRTLSEISDPAEVQRLTSACSRENSVRRPDVAIDRDDNQARSSSWFSGPVRTFVARCFAGLFVIAILLSGVPSVSAQSSRRGEESQKTRVNGNADVKNDWNEERPKNVRPAAFEQERTAGIEPHQFLSPQQMGLSVKMLAVMTVLSLVPTILLMTTCYVRFIVVIGLLRQALGTQQGPPNQVMSAICLFLTILVMSPVWQRSYDEGIRPYTNPNLGEPAIDEATALARTIAPVRSFMSQQIEKAGNSGVVWMLHDFYRQGSKEAKTAEPQSYDDLSFAVLTPAYLLSELKVGFLIGFQLFLPFLVIDLIVSIVLTSLGLNMLTPSMVSLPFKLLLFVLIDGWFLTVGMLLESVKVV